MESLIMVGWLGFPVISMGYEQDLTQIQSAYCQRGSGVGTLGIKQPIYTGKYYRFSIDYDHKSCMIEVDTGQYDAIGIKFEMDTRGIFR